MDLSVNYETLVICFILETYLAITIIISWIIFMKFAKFILLKWNGGFEGVK